MNFCFRRVLLYLCLCVPGMLRCQVLPYQSDREIPLAGVNAQTAPIPAGLITSVTFLADPSEQQGRTRPSRIGETAGRHTALSRYAS